MADEVAPQAPTTETPAPDGETSQTYEITQVDHLNAKLLKMFQTHINENEDLYVMDNGAESDNDEWND